jgi:hypothetical protein
MSQGGRQMQIGNGVFLNIYFNPRNDLKKFSFYKNNHSSITERYLWEATVIDTKVK